MTLAVSVLLCDYAVQEEIHVSLVVSSQAAD